MSRDTARKVLEIELEPIRDAELREILGREGCLRELIEAILRALGEWERVTAAAGASVGRP